MLMHHICKLADHVLFLHLVSTNLSMTSHLRDILLMIRRLECMDSVYDTPVASISSHNRWMEHNHQQNVIIILLHVTSIYLSAVAYNQCPNTRKCTFILYTV